MTDVPLDLLTVHPLLEPMPPLPYDAPEMRAMIDGIELHGVLRPVIVNARREIMTDDGRSVARAAEKAGLDHLPTIVRPDEDAPALILTALCGYRHLSKSALAYLAFPLMEAGRESRLARRTSNLKAGAKSRASRTVTFGETVDDIAERMGFGRNHYYQGRQVHALFAQQPAYKAQMEPLLLSGDEREQVSLQGVLAGWTGKLNEGQPRRQSDQLDLFGKAFDALRYHFTRTWGSMDADRRAALAPEIRETVADMPPEVRDLFAKAIKEASKPAPQPV